MEKEKMINGVLHIYCEELEEYLPKFKTKCGMEFELNEDFIYLLKGTVDNGSLQNEISEKYESYNLAPTSYGKQRERFLIENRPELYEEMVIFSSLDKHLIDIDTEAFALEEKLIKEMCVREGVNNELKSRDWEEYIGKYNNIRNRVRETVRNELIYV